jgi:hypothetical protein
VRERFLEWTQSHGKQLWQTARAKSGQGVSSGSGDKKIKTMIIPVAAPGCGKTLLGLTLSRLFGFAHTQSDDVTTKRTAAGFLKNIETLLKKEDVVYCDRCVLLETTIHWLVAGTKISISNSSNIETTIFLNITRNCLIWRDHYPTIKLISRPLLSYGMLILYHSTEHFASPRNESSLVAKITNLYDPILMIK